MRLPRLQIVLLSLSILPCFDGGISTARAAAPTDRNVVLQPSDEQGNQVAGPGYWQVTATPGQTIPLYALVGNVGRGTINVSLVPVDARSGVYGGISYNLPEQKRKIVGSWVALSASKVHIHAGHAAVVGVTLRVPARIAPGQYIGGLTAFVPTRKAHSTQIGPNRDGAILLQLRRVVAIEVTVPGSSLNSFKISKVNPKKRPDAVYLIAHIRNAGTLLLKGQGHLWVWKTRVRKPVVSVNLAVDTTVPHTTVLYPVFWSRHPAPGSYRYAITIAWAGGHVQRSGSFGWTR